MTIHELWDQIDAWYAENAPEEQPLNDGASDDDIARVESILGVQLPDEIKASLRRHDGSDEECWATGTLASCEDMISDTEIWREIEAKHADDAAFVSESPELKEGWWRDGWVMIDRDGAGNGNAVDLDPSDQGSHGQLIDMDHEVGPSLSYANYVEYLEDCLAELQKGRWDDGYYLHSDLI